jgi:ligand-binding SRPBCC domain-containing protein
MSAMKMHHLTRSQLLPIPQDVAWAFFANPANLLLLTPPWMYLRDESLEHPKVAYSGLIQIHRVKLLGLFPVQWVSEMTHIDAPSRFVDEQKSGPFAFWHHTHQLLPTKGGVIVKDIVYYALRGGLVGQLAHAMFVRPQLERLFNYRAKMLEEFFGES